MENRIIRLRGLDVKPRHDRSSRVARIAHALLLERLRASDRRTAVGEERFPRETRSLRPVDRFHKSLFDRVEDCDAVVTPFCSRIGKDFLQEKVEFAFAVVRAPHGNRIAPQSPSAGPLDQFGHRAVKGDLVETDLAAETSHCIRAG